MKYDYRIVSDDESAQEVCEAHVTTSCVCLDIKIYHHWRPLFGNCKFHFKFNGKFLCLPADGSCNVKFH